MKLYFFKSNNDKDKLNCLSVLTSSIERAYKLASINFNKNNYKGSPEIIVI